MAKISGKQVEGQGGNSLVSFHEQEQDSVESGDDDPLCQGQGAWVDTVIQPTLSIRHARPLRERILRVLIAQSGLFIHVIAQRVDADPKRVGQELRGLMADGAVFKRKEHQGTYFKYYLLEGYFEPATPVKLRIDESVEVLHRLTLLKRMREKLISEHHYLLDAVIKDYENTLVEPDDE